MASIDLVPSASSESEDALHRDQVREIRLLDRLAQWVGTHRKIVFIAWAILILASAPFALTLTGALSGAGWDAKGSVSESVRTELRTDFAALGAEAALVVYQQDTAISLDDAGVRALIDSLGSAPSATLLSDPLTAPDESGLISPDGTTALIPMQLAGSADEDLPVSAGHLIEYVDGLAVPANATVAVTGTWPVWSDFNDTNEEALHKAELLSGLPSLILLFLAFGSALAAGLPLILAIAGIAFSFGALHVLSLISPLSVWSMNFSMMIGLAVGIDYSLFIVSRYRDELDEGKEPIRAISATLSTAGLAVLLSAFSVILSLAAVFIVPVMVFQSMALGMILAVAAVAVSALTLLPVVLLAMGDRVRRKPRPQTLATGARRSTFSWLRLAITKPGLSLAIGLVLLFALVLPAFGMRLGMPDARVVDEGRSSRDGYELLAAAFGEGAGAPIFITVDSAEAERAADVARAHEQTLAAQIVTAPSPSDRVVLRVTSHEGASAESTMDLVSDLRADLSDTSPSALVGGPAAQNHDLTDVLTHRAPYAVAMIMLGAFLLLLIVFRSLVVALISVLLDLLSVAAAFGFATIVFQHGFGTSLIGIESQGFVNAWAPIFFFALLFGLSMDYQLFLLSAIRERYEQTGDTVLAVRDGVARTGRPITNAALIMIVVFIAFGVTGPIPPTELGITLAFAVLLDATVVRMVLVPAIMTMLGERNWWLPAWLDRRMPQIDFSH